MARRFPGPAERWDTSPFWPGPPPRRAKRRAPSSTPSPLPAKAGRGSLPDKRVIQETRLVKEVMHPSAVHGNDTRKMARVARGFPPWSMFRRANASLPPFFAWILYFFQAEGDVPSVKRQDHDGKDVGQQNRHSRQEWGLESNDPAGLQRSGVLPTGQPEDLTGFRFGIDDPAFRNAGMF